MVTGKDLIAAEEEKGSTEKLLLSWKELDQRKALVGWIKKMVLFSSIGENGGQGNADKLVAVVGLFEERRRGWYRKRRGRRGMGQIFLFFF